MRLGTVFGGQRRWLRRRRLRRDAIEVGDRAGCLRNRNRFQFVGDRSGKTLFRSATPATSAAAATAPRPPFARALIGTRLVRQFAAFLVIGLFVGGIRIRWGGGLLRQSIVLARCVVFARFSVAAAAAPPPTSPSPCTVACGLRTCFATGGGFVRKSLGFFGLYFRFRLGVEQLLVVEGFFKSRGSGSGLRHEQRLCGLQRMYLFAAIDHIRLLSAHGRIGDH